MIRRRQQEQVERALAHFPAVALIGPRQVGKTTLARAVADHHPGSTYLDLERPADLRRLSDADSYIRDHLGRLLVIDEVHRAPGLFEILRGVIDEGRRQGYRQGQFLLLGSASPALMGMASESLAGRIQPIELAPIDPVEAAPDVPINDVWLRGGFPDSLLAVDTQSSLEWRQAFIRTYLERDVPMFAPRVPGATVGRLWQMLAHQSGGVLNAANLASGLGVTGPTISRYVDLLADLGLARILTPWHTNTAKRLVRRPKVYLRDTGILHALVGVETLDDLRGHPVVGPSFETLVIETVIALTAQTHAPSFLRTADGAEVDLLLTRGGRPDIAIEVKLSSAPVPSAGFYRSAEQLGAKALVVYPGDEIYSLRNGVTAAPLALLEEVLS